MRLLQAVDARHSSSEVDVEVQGLAEFLSSLRVRVRLWMHEDTQRLLLV